MAARSTAEARQEPDTKPGPYYVSIVRHGGTPLQRVGLLAGPFGYHADALALVERVRVEAEKVDSWAAFDSFGTVRVEGETKPGRLNERLGLTARELAGIRCRTCEKVLVDEELEECEGCREVRVYPVGVWP